jgi:hypothetical protein
MFDSRDFLRQDQVSGRLSEIEMSGVYPLNEWQSKVHDIKRTHAYAYASKTMEALRETANAVAAAMQLFAATSDTVKGMARATEKVMEFGEGTYNGDWWAIKDLARCTIAVNDDTQGEKVFQDCINKFFIASNGWSVREQKRKKSDPKGYSDWKVIVSKNGSLAEVQINTKNLLYAKDLPFFRAVCPGEEAAMKAKYMPVPGGIGHLLYEWSRVPGPRSQTAEALGLRYYAHFRTPNVVQAWKLFEDILKMGINPAQIH